MPFKKLKAENVDQQQYFVSLPQLSELHVVPNDTKAMYCFQIILHCELFSVKDFLTSGFVEQEVVVFLYKVVAFAQP